MTKVPESPRNKPQGSEIKKSGLGKGLVMRVLTGVSVLACLALSSVQAQDKILVTSSGTTKDGLDSTTAALYFNKNMNYTTFDHGKPLSLERTKKDKFPSKKIDVGLLPQYCKDITKGEVELKTESNDGGRTVHLTILTISRVLNWTEIVGAASDPDGDGIINKRTVVVSEYGSPIRKYNCDPKDEDFSDCWEVGNR